MVFPSQLRSHVIAGVPYVSSLPSTAIPLYIYIYRYIIVELYSLGCNLFQVLFARYSCLATMLPNPLSFSI